MPKNKNPLLHMIELRPSLKSKRTGELFFNDKQLKKFYEANGKK